MLQPQHPGQAERDQQQAFDQQAGLGVDGHALSDHPIAGEADGQDDGDPRRATEGGGLEGHADGGQADGDPAPFVDLLAEQPQAHDHVEQRVDVVAEAGLQRGLMGGGPDIEAPVDGDQQGRGRQPAQGPGRGEGSPHLGTLFRQHDQQAGDRHRPQGAVGEDLERVEAERALPHEQQGHEPPHDIAAEGREQGGAGRGGRGGRHGHQTVMLRYPDDGLMVPVSSSSWAIWTALRAAPLRRLSETIQSDRPFSTVGSLRMRLT